MTAPAQGLPKLADVHWRAVVNAGTWPEVLHRYIACKRAAEAAGGPALISEEVFSACGAPPQQFPPCTYPVICFQKPSPRTFQASDQRPQYNEIWCSRGLQGWKCWDAKVPHDRCRKPSRMLFTHRKILMPVALHLNCPQRCSTFTAQQLQSLVQDFGCPCSLEFLPSEASIRAVSSFHLPASHHSLFCAAIQIDSLHKHF